jgi:hypothetical protein
VLPVTRKQRRKRAPGWVWAAAAVGVVTVLCVGLPLGGLLLAWWHYANWPYNEVTYTSMSAEAFREEWRGNPAAGVSKYRNPHGVEFVAVIVAIDSNNWRQTIVTVSPPGSENDPQSFIHVGVLRDAAKGDLTKCKVGEAARFRCVTDEAVRGTPGLHAVRVLPPE